MGSKVFREGGSHNIRQIFEDQYEMSISMPPDADGRVARACPSDTCSPGYFKVKPGTGITSGQEVVYCPYCRHAAEPANFTTQEQLRYAKEVALQEAHKGLEEMLKDACGLGLSGKKKMGGDLLSIEMSYKSGPKPHVCRPFEEEVRRDVTCPRCGLDHSVYGLATWCSDCGEDIFLTHVEAELSVVQAMLSDIERRRSTLGVRIAAKDIENCLEDTVSIFEAVLRAFVRRLLDLQDASEEDVNRFFKKLGNAFQNVERSEKAFVNGFNASLFQDMSAENVDFLADTFAKRHPITHNLGVIDKKYIETARTFECEGREILVTASEIEKAIELCQRIFRSVHERLLRAPAL